MRFFILSFVFMCNCMYSNAQQTMNKPIVPNAQPNTENIYTIKKQFLEKVLHNPATKNEGGADNDLERFNRWFNFVEPRCYPSGNMPRPDILLTEYNKSRQAAAKTGRTTGNVPVWKPLGPTNVPSNFFGIGRINCIVIDPQDTGTLYVGAACGGVWVSHDAGATWSTNSDNFPSLSIADIAVNPRHPDTLYAATGDGYGSVLDGQGIDSIFWGGLYSAGVMKSTDGGNTWNTTGLSYLQSNREVIHKLLIYPGDPSVLLAATSNGMYRTADAGATWTIVDTGCIFSMAFRPQQPDTVYAINASDLRVSYNAGITWQTLSAGMNTTQDRCTIAVSPASPQSIWVLNNLDYLLVSHNEGQTFTNLGSPTPGATFFWGYYDRVLGISPTDSNIMFASGLNIGSSADGGNTWVTFDSTLHPDNHAVAFNPLHPSTIYFGNDGGIVVTRDNGNTWANISNGLEISQIYRISSSRQNPYLMLCGLQDNATFYNNGAGWAISNGPFGDGMDCAIFPGSDLIQIASTEEGNFAISYDQGATFNQIPNPYTATYWTAPVIFDPYNADTIYFGYDDIYASYDGGFSMNKITSMAPFPYGAVSLALAPANTNVLYAADLGHILRTMDAGASWLDVTGNLGLQFLPITRIAVDAKNPMLVYATTSGYSPGEKVYMSATGGITWVNISGSLPNIPANCIVADSSIRGALYVATDIGVYYKDSTMADWELFGTGLPNVVVQHLEINYTNRKLRAPTYGRGVWETDLQKYTSGIPSVASSSVPEIQLFPNPTTNSWKVAFSTQKPANFTVKLSDVSGKVVRTQKNSDVIDASKLAAGEYNIEVAVGQNHYQLKAIRE